MSGADPLRGLLERSVEGDEVALGQLVRSTQSDVWRLCAALGSPGEVDDLVQDTYLRVIRAAPSFRGESTVRTWLLAISRRACADHVRRRERHRRLVERVAERGVWSAEPGPTESMVLLDLLSPPRREAFVLTQVLDLSYEDAAAVAGCPIGTIRSRVSRARADLIAVVSADADADSA